MINDRVLILISFIGDEIGIGEDLQDEQMMCHCFNFALYSDLKAELLVMRMDLRLNLTLNSRSDLRSNLR